MFTTVALILYPASPFGAESEHNVHGIRATNCIDLAILDTHDTSGGSVTEKLPERKRKMQKKSYFRTDAHITHRVEEDDKTSWKPIAHSQLKSNAETGSFALIHSTLLKNMTTSANSMVPPPFISSYSPSESGSVGGFSLAGYRQDCLGLDVIRLGDLCRKNRPGFGYSHFGWYKSLLPGRCIPGSSRCCRVSRHC